MNTNPIQPKTQAPTSQGTLVLTSTANKAEMLRRLEQAYQLGNQVYERIGKVIDTVYDKREAIAAFQATDELSTSQVDQIFQTLAKAWEMIDQELNWLFEDD